MDWYLAQRLNQQLVLFVQVLNIDSSADEQEVSVAYRRLVKEWHPDKHKDPGMKKVAEVEFHKTQQNEEKELRPLSVLKDVEQICHNKSREIFLLHRRSSWKFNKLMRLCPPSKHEEQ